jgi:glutaredoxin
MRFFGFGKKRNPDPTHSPAIPTSRHDPPPNALSYRDLVVYGTSDGARCRQVRSLIATRGYVYQDVRVDEDLSTRSWLQRLTGDDALPKVFIGQKCYGGFEDIQRLIFDGRFDGILRGEADEASGKDEIAALKKEMSAAAISTLMRQGEILTITEGEMVMDAWAEPFANPPLVYHEGTPHPIDELATIVGRIMTRLKAGEIEISWKDDA